MTPKDMLELYRVCMDDGDDYARELEALLRRDWAVRVLVEFLRRGTVDADRFAKAMLGEEDQLLGVAKLNFDYLSPEVRAELGECP